MPRSTGMLDALNYYYKHVIEVQNIKFLKPNLDKKIE